LILYVKSFSMPSIKQKRNKNNQDTTVAMMAKSKGAKSREDVEKGQ
jgi:hypothetical protein